MASNHEDHSHIEPKENQPDPSNRGTFGSVANRIGASASGLISSSLRRPDPLSVCSSLASIGSDGIKARPVSASSSASTSSSSLAVGGLSSDGTWLARSTSQDQGQATQTSHLEQWRHYACRNTVTSEYDDFVSDSKAQTIQVGQTVGEYGSHAGSTPGSAAIRLGQFQAGIPADGSCQATKASPSQPITESFFNPIIDGSSPEDFTSDWKRLHVSSMMKSSSVVPEDGAEVVSLLSDTRFCPGGEFNQLQPSIDEFLLEGESWMSMSSQSKEIPESDSLWKSKAAPSAVNLAGPSPNEKIMCARDYLRFPARYTEEVWGYFSSTKPKQLVRGTVPSVAVNEYPKLDEPNDMGRFTALNRLVMVLNHLGPNPTKFEALN